MFSQRLKTFAFALILVNLSSATFPAFAADPCQVRILREQRAVAAEEKVLSDLKAKLDAAREKDGYVFAKGITVTGIGTLATIGGPIGAIVINFFKDMASQRPNQAKNMKKGLIVGAIGLIVTSYGVYTLVMKEDTAKEVKAAVAAKEILLERLNKQLDEDLKACEQQG